SETEISRCRAPNSTAVTAGLGCGAGELVFAGGLVFEGFSFRPCFAEGDFFDGFRIWRAPISTAVTADFGCGAGGLVFAGGLVSAAGLPFEGLSFWPRFAGGAFFDGFRICCAPISTAVTDGFVCGAGARGVAGVLGFPGGVVVT